MEREESLFEFEDGDFVLQIGKSIPEILLGATVSPKNVSSSCRKQPWMRPSRAVKMLEIVKQLPEECAVGEMVKAESVPHWNGRIRLTQFFPSILGPDEKPRVIAASYEGLDPIGWRRVE